MEEANTEGNVIELIDNDSDDNEVPVSSGSSTVVQRSKMKEKKVSCGRIDVERF